MCSVITMMTLLLFRNKCLKFIINDSFDGDFSFSFEAKRPEAEEYAVTAPSSAKTFIKKLDHAGFSTIEYISKDVTVFQALGQSGS